MLEKSDLPEFDDLKALEMNCIMIRWEEERISNVLSVSVTLWSGAEKEVTELGGAINCIYVLKHVMSFTTRHSLRPGWLASCFCSN